MHYRFSIRHGHFQLRDQRPKWPGFKVPAAQAPPGVKHYKLGIEVFEDAYNVHKYVDRSLTGYYFIPANLPLHEREKRENIFTMAIAEKGAPLLVVHRC